MGGLDRKDFEDKIVLDYHFFLKFYTSPFILVLMIYFYEFHSLIALKMLVLIC